MRTLQRIARMFLAASLVVFVGCACCSRRSAGPWPAERAAGQTVASAENAHLNPMACPWAQLAPEATRVASH